MKNIVTFSGGKDSQAVAIWALHNLDSFELVFSDTGWEAKETYKFILDFEKLINRNITRLKSSKYNGFQDLVKKRKMFPSGARRACTLDLKVAPMIDYILSLEQDVNIYQGIRHQESRNRASMQKIENYFNGYITPKKRIDRRLLLLEMKKKFSPIFGPTEKQKEDYKKLENLIAKTGPFKDTYYSYRKKDVLKWAELHECTAIRPIITWRTKQVFEYISNEGFKRNPLYDKGFSRVGCFPCINCRQSELLRVSEIDPERIDIIEKLENLPALKKREAKFLRPNYFSKKDAKPIPIKKAIEHLKKKNPPTELLPPTTCKNKFVQCE